jgi:hypothetical protein
MGIEPMPETGKVSVLPLNYTRLFSTDEPHSKFST